MVHCLFWEILRQDPTAWPWRTVGCSTFQIDPVTKCFLSSALCHFCGGATRLFGSWPHIIICVMIQTPTSTSPTHLKEGFRSHV